MMENIKSMRVFLGFCPDCGTQMMNKKGFHLYKCPKCHAEVTHQLASEIRNRAILLDEYQEMSKDTAIYPSKFDLMISALDRAYQETPTSFCESPEILRIKECLQSLITIPSKDRFIRKQGIFGNIDYVVEGLAGEAGELAGKVKKVMRDNQGEFTPEKVQAIKDEVGDCFWYLAQIGSELGFKLSEAVVENRLKLLDRQERGKLGGSGDKR